MAEHSIPRPSAPSLKRVDFLWLMALAAAVRIGYFLISPDTNPFRLINLEGTDLATYQQWATSIIHGSGGRGFIPFPNAPLYPYLLAACAAAGGSILSAAAVLNMCLGVANVGLTGAIASRFLPRWTAIATAMAMALCVPALVFEQLNLSDTLAFALHAAMVWALMRVRETGKPREALVAGLLCGAAFVARPTFLLIAMVLAATTFVQRDRERKFRVARPALVTWFAAALAMPLLFSVLQLQLGGPFSPLPSTGSVNIFLGNAPDADGTFGYPPSYRRITEHDSSPAFVSAVVLSLANDHIGWLRLTGRKLLLTINGSCPAQNESCSFLAELSLGSVNCAWGFESAAAFGWVGVVACWPRRREFSFLYALLAIDVVATASIFVVGRFKLPLLLPLTIFAMAGLAWMVREFRARRWRFAFIPLGALLVVGLLEPDEALDLRVTDVNNLAIAWNRLGQTEKAWEVRSRAVDLHPVRTDLRSSFAMELAADRQLPAVINVLRLGLNLNKNLPANDFALLVFAEHALGHDSAAEAAAIEALHKYPNDSQLRSRLKEIGVRLP